MNYLNAEMNKSISDPAIKEQLAVRGYETMPMSVAQCTEFVRRENAKWADVVKRAAIKGE
jgi:tripartite-type tricarboxylate transporter receptor subunit TctC